MAASPRASARRCSKARSTTRTASSVRLVHGLHHAARRRPAVVQGRHDRRPSARPIRSASRAAARRARSRRRPRSSTRSPTRSAREDIAMPATPPGGVGGDPARPRQPQGGAADIRGLGDDSMYELQLSPPEPVCGRRPTCSARLEDAKLLAGGQTLLPTMKQRLASPADIVDLDQIEGLDRHRAQGPLARHRRDDPPCRGGEFAERCSEAIPALAELAGDDRRSGGAPPRHHRRLGRQQRSERRLSGRLPRRSAPPSSPTSARSRPTSSSRACSRPRSSPTRSSPR